MALFRNALQLFLTVAFSGIFPNVTAQSNDSCFKNATHLIETLNEHHISPLQQDTIASRKVYDEFVNLINLGNLYFTEKNLARLAHYKKNIFRSIESGDCSFFQMAQITFHEGLNERKELIKATLNSPLKYSIEETYRDISSRTNLAPLQQPELEKHWRAKLKFEVLLWMAQHNESKLSTLTPNVFNQLESEARAAILTREVGLIDRLLVANDKLNGFLENKLLKAIARSYDPHSDYFDAPEKKDFESALSTSGLSFGFELKENHVGKFEISRITPGSAAWLSGELTKGDILIGVTVEKTNYRDAASYSFEELYEELNKSSINKVILHVKKLSGQERSVELTKSEIELNQNLIEGYLLKGEKNIGYISLQNFYTDFESKNNTGCADDLARELVKMKKEKIDGLILDLRYNGGGSLYEAVALAGIFIDFGPLALMQEKAQPLFTLKDTNKGTIYDGPVALLVNGFSASASEIVSAVLQDFNRAIIIGSKTFGKATGQLILPVNRSDQHFVKVTIDKIYRITGKTIQQKGITPDIHLPDIFERSIVREGDIPTSLSADSVIKKVYYTPLPTLPITDLKIKSDNRRLASPEFKKIKEIDSLLERPVPLHLKEFDNYYTLFSTLAKEENATSNFPVSYKVTNTQFDNDLLNMDNNRRQIKSEHIKEIERSVYIKEAYHVIIDLIAYKK